VPAGILRTDGVNTLAIGVWNEDDSTGGLGAVSLDRYANLASSLTVRDVRSPGYRPRRYALAPATGHLSLRPPDVIQRGGTGTVTATFADPADRPTARNVVVALRAPDGWTVTPSRPAPLGDVRPGATPPPPPTGTVFVSNLAFLSATNGWGPVERDLSNGEIQPGDGHTITLNGVQYAKGLGVNAVSDVALYLGGNCSRFTATLGVDDEVGNSGSVTFSVVADGRALSTTPVLTGSSAPVSIDDDVGGAQRLDLVTGDGGDGNGLDHGDWADAKLVCSP
jgi:NPCBM/NEW2 domain/NPCBM-associated, NEW3 domain of alpha-galactosidase